MYPFDEAQSSRVYLYYLTVLRKKEFQFSKVERLSQVMTNSSVRVFTNWIFCEKSC